MSALVDWREFAPDRARGLHAARVYLRATRARRLRRRLLQGATVALVTLDLVLLAWFAVARDRSRALVRRDP